MLLTISPPSAEQSYKIDKSPNQNQVQQCLNSNPISLSSQRHHHAPAFVRVDVVPALHPHTLVVVHSPCGVNVTARLVREEPVGKLLAVLFVALLFFLA